MKFLKTKIVVSFLILIMLAIIWGQFVRMLNGSTSEIVFALVAALAGIIALPTTFRYIWAR